MQRPRPRRSESKSTSHANARAPNLTILKPQQKNIRNKKHHTNAAPFPPLITEKRGRPRPKGGNNIAFNYECCNYIIIAASLLAGSPQYTLVSGPNGPLTRRYAPTSVNLVGTTPTAHRSYFMAKSGYGLTGAGWVR